MTPEARARQDIDAMLNAAGWIVQDRKAANPSAGRGVAIREFPMKSGFGEADYLLYVDVERGKRNISILNLDLIAEGLGVSLAQLFSRLKY